MNDKGLRAGPGEHDDSFGIEVGEAEVPEFLLRLGGLAGPAEQVHASIQPGTDPLGNAPFFCLFGRSGCR